MKHAFLIIAHDNREVLECLLRKLDDERNDVFLHVDKKASFEGNDFQLKKGKLFNLNNRIDARWGDFCLVAIELELIKAALTQGNYEYLHLISGVDLPIKSLEEIYSGCENNKGKEFIGFSQNVSSKDLNWRTQNYFIFSRQFKSRNIIKRAIRYAFVKFQSLVGCKRCPLEIKKGPQWWSITSDFARYIISKEKYIKKYFTHTYCPDEIVFQTLCWNSPFKDNIYRIDDEFKGCRRYIPWENGELKSLADTDFDKMQNADYWFARKFNKSNLSLYEQLFSHRYN